MKIIHYFLLFYFCVVVHIEAMDNYLAMNKRFFQSRELIAADKITEGIKLLEDLFEPSKKYPALFSDVVFDLLMQFRRESRPEMFAKMEKYAIEIYNLSKDWQSKSGERQDDLRRNRAIAANTLGRWYGYNKAVASPKKAIPLLEEAYQIAKDIDLKALYLNDIGEYYYLNFNTVEERKKAKDFFQRALDLHITNQELIEKTRQYLKLMGPEDLVDVIESDGSTMQLDLNARDVYRIDLQSIAQAIVNAAKNNHDFIISKVTYLNFLKNGASPLFGEAGLVIGKLLNSDRNDFVSTNSKMRRLDLKTALSFSSGAQVSDIDFYKYVPEKKRFEYLFSYNDLFGAAGRRNRLYLISNDATAIPLLQAEVAAEYASILLLLGGEKNLREAEKYSDRALSNSAYGEIGKIFIKSNLLPTIYFDLAKELVTKNPEESIRYFQRASMQSDNIVVQIAALMYLVHNYYQNKQFSLALFLIDKILAIDTAKPLVKRFYIRFKQKIMHKMQEEQRLTAQEEAKKQLTSIQTVSKMVKKQPSKASPAKIIAQPSVHVPSLSDQAILPEALPELQDEKSFEKDEDEAFKAMQYLINEQKVASLLKEFDKSLQEYKSNKRLYDLKDAKMFLETITSLTINDTALASNVARAQDQWMQALAQSSSLDEAKKDMPVSTQKIILDPFDEKNALPAELQKTLDQNLQTLTRDPYALGAVKVQTVNNYPLMRIHISKNYRLFYIITDSFIGIVGLAKKGSSTYNKLDQKYADRIAWFANAQDASIEQLWQLIAQEQEKGHEQRAQALILLCSHKADQNAEQKKRCQQPKAE